MHQLRVIRHVRLGVKNLLLHKLRSLLTMLGVVFGVGSVVAMLSVGEGASKQAMEQIRKLGSNNILITAKKPAEEESSGVMHRHLSMYGLEYEDASRIRATFPEIERVIPAKILPRQGRLGERSADLRIVGTSAGWFEVVPRPIVAGRVLLDRDEEEFGSAVVLTETGARRLLATQNAIGQWLRIGGSQYQVIGIVQNESNEGGTIDTPDQAIDAYVPINLARQQFGDFYTQRTAGGYNREMVELHKIIVQVRRSEDVEGVSAGIEGMLRKFHKSVDYEIKVPLALLRQAEQTKRTYNIVLGSIAGISLLVGGIGIMNIMLASVTERTREIGIRRAIGAKRRQIIGQFLIETVVLSTLGGLIGVAIGVLFPQIITWYAQMPTVVTGWSVLLSVGISVAVGIFFGLYPAIRAARLDPIEALRHE